jgi:hypothetical protein
VPNLPTGREIYPSDNIEENIKLSLVGGEVKNLLANYFPK